MGRPFPSTPLRPDHLQRWCYAPSLLHTTGLTGVHAWEQIVILWLSCQLAVATSIHHMHVCARMCITRTPIWLEIGALACSTCHYLSSIGHMLLQICLLHGKTKDYFRHNIIISNRYKRIHLHTHYSLFFQCIHSQWSKQKVSSSELDNSHLNGC